MSYHQVYNILLFLSTLDFSSRIFMQNNGYKFEKQSGGQYEKKALKLQ
jgi:hypothetical protein